MAVRGILTALFKLDTKQAEKGAAKLKRTLGQDLQGSLKRMGGSAGVAGSALSSFGGMGLAAAAGVGALVAAVGLGTRSLLKMGVEFTTLRDKTALSLGFLQEMKFVSDQLNVNFDQVTNSVLRLGRRTAADLPETRKFVEALGLSMSDLVAAKPEEAFLNVVDAISKLKNPAEQAAAAMGIFGDAGLQVLPLIRGDVEALREEFDALGGKIDDDVLESARKFDDAMTSLKTTLAGVAGETLGPIIEALADLAAGFVEAQKEGRALAQNELFSQDKILKDKAREIASIVGPGIRNDADKKRLDELREEVKARRDVLSQVERLEDSLKRGVQLGADGLGVINKQTEKVRTLLDREKTRAKVLAEIVGIQQEGTESLEDSARLAEAMAIGMEHFPESANQSLEVVRGIGDGFDDISVALDDAVVGVGDLEGSTVDLEAAQQRYNDALAAANDLAQLIGGTLGSLIGQTAALGASLQNLTAGDGGLFGGLKNAFSGGKGQGGGLIGLLGGIGGLAGAAGPMISAGVEIGKALVGGIKKLFGKSDLVKDAARDLGASISQEMADSIRASGQPLQTALAEIFQAGGFDSIDRFAEEVGDLFSAFDQGRISQPQLLTELEETLPILIANFEELGPAGEEQLERIIAAADHLGISMDELDQLIQKTFAPSTMEEMAAAFGLSNDEVRAMADTLGIDVQTNLEKVAASVGLTAGEFKALGAALEEKLGIPAEQLAEFLEATGISAAELAEKLGVDVGAGAGIAADAQEAANERIAAGADFAANLADQLERAARASHNINVPVGAGGSAPRTAKGTVTRGPETRLIGEAGAEVVAPVAALFGSLGNDIARKVAGAGGGGSSEVVAAIRRLEASLPDTVGRSVRDNIAKAVG